MIHAQALHLVKGDQHPREEELVLLLQRKGESVDDRTKDLQQLGNAVEPFCLVGELEKDVVDGAADEGPQVEELAVDAVQGRLQEVPFPRIFGVEQLQELEDEAVVDVCFRDVGVEVLALDEAKEELVHDLDVRPGDFQDGLVLLGVESVALRVHGRRDGAEEVLGEHVDYDGVHGLGDDLAVVGHVVQELVEGQALDLLGLHIGAGIVEVEDDVALLDLLHEQILTAPGGDLVEAGELLQLAVGGDLEPRRMLPPGRLWAVEHVLGSLLQPVVHQRLLAGLWRSEIVRHGLGRAGRGDVLSGLLCVSHGPANRPATDTGAGVLSYRSARADDDGRGQSAMSTGRAAAVGGLRLSTNAAVSVGQARVEPRIAVLALGS